VDIFLSVLHQVSRKRGTKGTEGWVFGMVGRYLQISMGWRGKDGFRGWMEGNPKFPRDGGMWMNKKIKIKKYEQNL
jgi:hypothetical protein